MSDERRAGKRFVRPLKTTLYGQQWEVWEPEEGRETPNYIGVCARLPDADFLARAADYRAAVESLEEIATHGDDDHPCEHESITWCRAHIEKTARAVLARLKHT